MTLGHDKLRDLFRQHNLAHDLERLPAEAFLATNLEKQDYLDIVCGESLDNLPHAFAELDTADRSNALPVRIRSAEQNAAADTVSSSLPKSDRNLVRKPAWQERVHAEARSRAPQPQAAGRRGRPITE